MTKFIGREKELESLKGLLRKKSSSLVVIRGRRRIGKSRLAEEYASSFNKAYILSGIPPEPGITAEAQRAEFLRQLQEYRLRRSIAGMIRGLLHCIKLKFGGGETYSELLINQSYQISRF